MQKQFTKLVQEIYTAGSVPIVSRTLVSVYVEVAQSGGDASKMVLERIGENDERVENNQLWTSQKTGT